MSSVVYQWKAKKSGFPIVLNRTCVSYKNSREIYMNLTSRYTLERSKINFIFYDYYINNNFPLRFKATEEIFVLRQVVYLQQSPIDKVTLHNTPYK